MEQQLLERTYTNGQSPPPVIGIYDFPEFITTKRSPVSMLSGDLVKIKVVDFFSKKSKGLLSYTRNFCVIETEPYDWKVQRDCNDLIEYRELIMKQFPGDIVDLLYYIT